MGSFTTMLLSESTFVQRFYFILWIIKYYYYTLIILNALRSQPYAYKIFDMKEKKKANKCVYYCLAFRTSSLTTSNDRSSKHAYRLAPHRFVFWTYYNVCRFFCKYTLHNIKKKCHTSLSQVTLEENSLKENKIDDFTFSDLARSLIQSI